ncbi:MAG: hypothetical protein CVV47_03345 [Spirochaetae bacterium HGW-Spirochaetae-3]|nr:MAG: hypothetical protein CVV47_03345 [Spirochaetae bacterium HGW-Spirochaetae-3]
MLRPPPERGHRQQANASYVAYHLPLIALVPVSRLLYGSAAMRAMVEGHATGTILLVAPLRYLHLEHTLLLVHGEYLMSGPSLSWFHHDRARVACFRA